MKIPSIEMKNVMRFFGNKKVVQDLNLQLYPGEILGFLGPNGAGKTTSIRMMAGLLPPSSGNIRILGKTYEKEPLEIKKNIGIIFDEPQFFSFLTGEELLEFNLHIYGIPQEKYLQNIDLLKEGFHIDFLSQKGDTLSHGMKQKVALLATLAREPEILFLDEPTVGLDAYGISFLKKWLLLQTEKGKSVILTTHVLEIAEKLSSRLFIMNQGKEIISGTLEEMQSQYASHDNLESFFLNLTQEEK